MELPQGPTPSGPVVYTYQSAFCNGSIEGVYRDIPPQCLPGPPPGLWPGPKPGPPQGPWPGPQLPVGQGAAVRVEGILASERRELYIEDHFAGSSEAQGGPVSYQAPVEVGVGAGVIVWARRGEIRAVSVVGRRNLIVFCMPFSPSIFFCNVWLKN